MFYNKSFQSINMKRSIVILVYLFVLLLQCQGEIKLPKLISNGMILQRDIKLKIWGWASADEEVSITFKNKIYQTKSDEKGNWFITLPAQKAGGPFSMQLKASNKITINNILIGDVWICGGQSNMELWMGRLKYKYADEIALSENKNIRQFLVPDKYNFKHPEEDLDGGEWLAVNRKSILDFSAIGYFFAKEIYEKYKIPVGLINTALGGSPAEAWISEEALKKFPSYYNEAQLFKRQQLIDSIEQHDQTISNNWYNLLNETDEGEKDSWRKVGLNDIDWKEINVPGYWADQGHGYFNGVVWYRKDFDVPASMTGKSAKVELGRIVDADSVFINGQYIGNTTYQYPPRRYEFSSNILHEGKNSIVVRLISNSGKGGFVPDKKYEITTSSDTINLLGKWKFKTGAVMKELPSQTFIRWKPVGLYNSMIAPVTKYAIKGVLWYQGESNADRPADYKELMQTLISDWRQKWHQGNYPFLFVQLANFMEPKSAPQESNWAALRQQQLNNLSIPNTGMVVAIDIGVWNDIHPENKKEVGHRLALLARKIAYGEKNLIASGPLYQSMEIKGNKIILHFADTGLGLIIKNGTALKQFAIAGADKKYVWANASIKGATVVVWNNEIIKPVAVRYAWADDPEGANLYNKEGLPASPFTTEK